MKKLLLALSSAVALMASGQSTFTGVITDTMCGKKHTMGINPNEKCVRECVKSDPKKWKYALQVGDKLYVLSDQQTPEKFAAQRVTVTGTLSGKTSILKVDKIALARN
jgi:hypothetical protein